MCVQARVSVAGFRMTALRTGKILKQGMGRGGGGGGDYRMMSSGSTQNECSPFGGERREKRSRRKHPLPVFCACVHYCVLCSLSACAHD